MKDSLYLTYKRLFEELVVGNLDITFSGSTAVTCFIKENYIYTANSGDSRGIIGSLCEDDRWKARVISRDHKPELKHELERIISRGGRVEPCKDGAGRYIGPHRVWLSEENLPGLAMSRSIGDLVGASVGVSWEPGKPFLSN